MMSNFARFSFLSAFAPLTSTKGSAAKRQMRLGRTLGQIGLCVSLLAIAAACDGPATGENSEEELLVMGESCTTSDQCGETLACFDDDNGGNATCECADTSMHDGGDGTCVSYGQCVSGFHDGGDRTCVPLGQCVPGVSLQGDDCLAAAAPICLQYLACSEHFDEVNGTSTGASISSPYADGGQCWDSIETAEACTQACASAVESLYDSLDAANDPVGPCE